MTDGSCVQAAFPMAQPCDCSAAQLIPVRSIVDHFAIPANNDNATIGLSPTVFTNPSGPQRLDLPCGNYYLQNINGSAPITIVAHGHTGLYVGGAITVNHNLVIDLDPTATLDIFVGGVMKLSQDFTLGSPAYPRLSRMYFGSGSCGGNSSSCTDNADCCSGSCAANSCIGGSNLTDAIQMSATSHLNGLLYGAYGRVFTSNPLTMFGAIFAQLYDASGPTVIHYDRGAVTDGTECPPPPTGCTSCQDCNNQACNSGVCGGCTQNSDCCAPLQCVGGTCLLQ